ncbi:unnamed protein product [Rotaria sp. Silwood2]|nr:unnamed protein product [Rotaria sp. Silwood2]CAF2713482.1 unnamed protein product [Rotaria sp. Silwood2]CAF2898494.1 unnamed protein product [Rotaria sp. Silwood2]CAF3125239.1 unnamed protein product [Rotaria sp. Silwood2]CAF3891988.1 unnamed protein product [Rotaria sp. Silwood2]
MNNINYFGYASNLKQSLFEERIGNNHPLSVNIARLIDYQFRFNHRQENGEGRANIMAKKGSYVYGLVYLINEKHLDYLLKTEPGHKMIKINIELVNDNKIIEAITFIDETTNEEDFTPSNEYLQTIINAAKQHKFPREYIDYIISIANIKQ